MRERIETAEAVLTEWMLASGTTQALLGLFELELAAGELHVIKHDVPNADQLPLPHLVPPPEPSREQPGFAIEQPASVLRIAESDVRPRRLDRLTGLSESELASLARVVLASLASAELAPLLARHEAGVLLTQPRQVFDLLSPEMSGLTHEQLRVLTLSTRHGLLGSHLVYQGTVRESPVRPAEVFRPAVVQQAPGVIVAHNHPSGDPSPSTDDLALTRQLAQAGSLLGIRVVDHVVIAGSSFYSFREGGHLSDTTTDKITVSDDTTPPTTAVYGEEGT